METVLRKPVHIDTQFWQTGYCYRGESCAYAHRESENNERSCTVKERPEENYMETIDVHECKQIRTAGDDECKKQIDSNIDIEQMDAEDLVVSIDNSNQIQNCQI